MKLGIVLALALLAGPAVAQHHGHGPGQTPYAGLQQRAIKALSDGQIADLKAGRGMGLALAAELNGYPGPMHVLELKDQLQLTADQRRRFQQLFDGMKAEAIAAGAAVIESERLLDQRFADRLMTADELARLTAQIGEAQAKLRAVHLKYHLTTADLLTGAQRLRYAELRGYR
jgi:hypothetical protein